MMSGKLEGRGGGGGNSHPPHFKVDEVTPFVQNERELFVSRLAVAELYGSRELGAVGGLGDDVGEVGGKLRIHPSSKSIWWLGLVLVQTCQSMACFAVP